MNGSAEETVLEHKRLLNDVVKELEVLISEILDNGMEHQQSVNTILEISRGSGTSQAHLSYTDTSSSCYAVAKARQDSLHEMNASQKD